MRGFVLYNYLKEIDSLFIEILQGEVLVHRQLSKTAPGLGDPNIDWHETVFLNMVLHQVNIFDCH